MRKLLTILIGKILIFLTRTTKAGGGSALPGLIAEKIDPNILPKLTQNLKMGSIIVTGTNGKTTTVKMISEVLKEAGFKPISNKSGSNMTRGVTSALIENCDLSGKISADIGVFEIDEATCPEATAKIETKIFLILDLFRDQLDRYGEIDKIAEILKANIKKLPSQTKVVLNADDPLVASLSKNALFFGLEDKNLNTTSYQHAADSKNCYTCGEDLEYKTNYFSHMGIYSCPKCKTTRPKPEIFAQNIKLKGSEGSEFRIKDLGFRIQIPGLYNIYNALAAISVAKVLGIKMDIIKQGLEKFSAAFGRIEKIKIKGKNVYMLLVKNPTSYNQVLQTILNPDYLKDKKISLLLGLNDLLSDGTDVSWIWDTDFEEIKNFNSNIKEIITSGIRAEDLTLRLKYACLEMKKIRMIKDYKTALKEALDNIKDDEILYILPTYTAMLAFRKVMAELGYIKEFLG